MMDSYETRVFLTLNEYFRYLEAVPNSRSVVEGEAILNAGHLIMCGNLEKSTHRVFEIFSLCLQTSALTANPHEITGKILVDEGSAVVSAFRCSCKAGLGGKCKHISAVLLHCTRTDLNKFEKVSSTDVKCWWTNKKKLTKTKYEALPILKTSCLKSKVPPKHQLPMQVEEDIRTFVISKMTNSSIAVHRNRNIDGGSADKTPECPAELSIIVKNSENSIFMKNFNEPELNYECHNCIEKYNGLTMFDTLDICRRTLVDKTLWEQERKFRVTGSRCYGLYTYSKNDWEEKCRTFFYPKEFSNVYTKHGTEYEPVARKHFEKQSGLLVVKTGLIICRSQPWLGYSPDGIIMKNDKPYGLLEIKCPYKAKQISGATSLKYIILKNGTYELKKKHQYYGQIQLGMAILNVNICHFIVYFSDSQSYIEIKVLLDEEYTHEMISSLKKKYVENMLHKICSCFV